MILGYLKYINIHATIVVFPSNTTNGKGGS